MNTQAASGARTRTLASLLAIVLVSSQADAAQPSACDAAANRVNVSTVSELISEIGGAYTCIRIAAGEYDVSGASAMRADESGLVINRTLALVGVGQVTLNAQHSVRVVEVHEGGSVGATVELHNLRMTGGSLAYPAASTTRGGCVLAHSCSACVFLTMTQVDIGDCDTNCTGSTQQDCANNGGGGVAVEGSNTFLTIRDSRIADSSASLGNSGKGGGLLAYSAKADSPCASSGNTACGARTSCPASVARAASSGRRRLAQAEVAAGGASAEQSLEGEVATDGQQEKEPPVPDEPTGRGRRLTECTSECSDWFVDCVVNVNTYAQCRSELDASNQGGLASCCAGQQSCTNTADMTLCQGGTCPTRATPQCGTTTGGGGGNCIGGASCPSQDQSSCTSTTGCQWQFAPVENGGQSENNQVENGQVENGGQSENNQVENGQVENGGHSENNQVENGQVENGGQSENGGGTTTNTNDCGCPTTLSCFSTPQTSHFSTTQPEICSSGSEDTWVGNVREKIELYNVTFANISTGTGGDVIRIWGTDGTWTTKMDYLTEIPLADNHEANSPPIVAIYPSTIFWCLSQQSCESWASDKADNSCSRDWEAVGQSWDQVYNEMLASCCSCPAGRWADYEASNKDLSEPFVGCHELCPAGSYRPFDSNLNHLNQTDADPSCAPGCTGCSAGHICPKDGMGEPMPCPRGTYNPAPGSPTNVSCMACPSGTYNNATGQPQCEACQAGKYTALPGQIACVDCPAGGYCDQVGADTPMVWQPCPSGTWSDTIGLNSSGGCHNCTAGQYNPKTSAVTNASCLPCMRGGFCLAGSSEMESCPAGRFGSDEGLENAACSGVCAQGYYCEEGAVSAKAAACPDGSYGDATGLVSENNCIACPEGHYCPEAAPEPTPCAVGSFANHTNMSSCALCPAGSFQNETGATHCATCSLGHFCVEGSSVERPCAAGSFGRTTGKESDAECEVCPRGAFCFAGAVLPMNCSAGTYAANQNSALCTACAAGSFQDLDGQSACKPCSRGFMCPKGSVVEIPAACNPGDFHNCSRGTECGDFNETADCHACPPGSWCAGGSSQPRACNRGTYCVGSASSETPCAAGLYGSEVGLSSADCSGICAQGYYCEEGSVSAKAAACDDGSYGHTTGLVSRDNCTACPEGSFCPDAAPAPTPCAVGSFADRPGMENCTACSAGTFQSAPGATDCAICGLGHYCVEGSSVERPCAAGFFGNETGLASAADCHACPPGSFCTTGVAHATSCPPGTVANVSGLPSCKKCAAGSFQEDSGETACDDCTRGSFCDEGASAALPCEQGTFGASEGLRSKNDCSICPPGSACSTGASSPEPCSPGSAANESRLPRCVSCSPGEFQNASNATQCEPCPIAHFCAGEGSSAATPCPGGTWSGAIGLRAEVQCIKVVKGQWAPTGSSAPEPCPDSGFYCPGYDALEAHAAQNITPPGSKPIIIDSGSARSVRNVDVVTFDLTLDSDVTEYDAVDTRTRLASLYSVLPEWISLRIVPASVQQHGGGGRRLLAQLQLNVTIKPPADSDGTTTVADLLSTVQSTSDAELTSALGASATRGLVAVEVVEEEYEATCPAGSWCSVGIMVACPQNTYNDNVNAKSQGACTACPDNAVTRGTSASHASACVCASTYFACPTACIEQPDGGSSTDRVCHCPDNATSSDMCSAASDGSGMECLPCPLGSRCDEPGFTLCSLDLVPGYWRQTNTSLDLRTCPDHSSSNDSSSGCQGGRGASPCKPELTGPYCQLCAEENTYYVAATGAQVSTCLECGTSGMSSEAGASLGVLVVVALILVLAWYLRESCKECASVYTEGGGKIDIEKVKNKLSFASQRLSSSRGESTRGLSKLGHAASRVRQVGKKVEERSWFKWLLVAGKFVVSFYQIATEIPDVYLVTLPASVQEVLATFESLSLDLFRFMPLECMGVGNLHHNLLLHILAPLGLMALSPLLGLCIARRVEAGRRVHAALMYALRICLAVSWLFYPAICSLAFQAFNCDTFEDGSSYLYADYSIACDANQPPPALATTAWVAVLLYCVGVPLVYLLLLWLAHDAIESGKPTELSKALAFLHGSYEVHYYWWEIFERLQALVLVGFIVLVEPGSLAQLVTGMMCALSFFMITIQAAPFEDEHDTFLCVGQKFSLVSFFFFCLVLKTVQFTEQVDESGVLSSVMRKKHLFEEDTLTLCLMCSVVGSLISASLMFVHRLRITMAAQVAQRAALKKLEDKKRELKELRETERATAQEMEAMEAVLSEDKIPDVLKRCMISADELELEKRLGAGAFGEVWRASLNGTPVAVKKLHRNKLDEANLKAFKAECKLQLSLRHPNIVQLLGCAWNLEDVNVCVVLELCERGTLQDMLDKEPRESTHLSWARHKLPIATGIAHGMAYLHSQDPPVIHRDLKPENILVDDGYVAKLADFGTSREADLEKTMEFAGTPMFMAPEMLRKEQYDAKIDVWSFACCLECMWTHEMVYAATMDEKKISADEVLNELVAKDKLGPMVVGFLAELVKQCSDFDPDQRCSFQQVLDSLTASTLKVEATRVDLQSVEALSSTPANLPTEAAPPPKAPTRRSAALKAAANALRLKEKTLPKPNAKKPKGPPQGGSVHV